MLRMRSKGMRTVFFKSTRTPSPSPSTSPSSSSPTATESIISEFIESCASQQYLTAVKDLHSSMLTFFKSEDDDASSQLLRAQSLLQSAMNRLDKEFIKILASTYNHLDECSPPSPSSQPSAISNFSDESNTDLVSDVKSPSVYDLKGIADCMLATGYGQECVRMYKSVRKPMIHQELHRIGVGGMACCRIQKMEWETLDLKIGEWLKVVRDAAITFLKKERLLCDMVLSSASPAIRDSCFIDIAKDATIPLLELPEIVARRKKSPEKIFRTLDLYEGMLRIIPHVKSLFSTDDIISQAEASLTRLADSVRSMLVDFEAAIEKEGSTSMIKGGCLHPLTRYVMNYLSLLSDYNITLSEVVVDLPLRVGYPLPETVFSVVDDEGGSPRSAISVWVAWLILVLLCKLDGKAGVYKDVSLAYIFLCNNLSYVVKKAQESNLGRLLGEGWVRRHEARVKQYACSYERMGWSNVMEWVAEIQVVGMPAPEEAKQRMMKFNTCFEETCRRQRLWVVTDAELRDEMKKSVARKLKPYKDFYERFREELGDELCVRLSPENFDNYISDLFHGGDWMVL